MNEEDIIVPGDVELPVDPNAQTIGNEPVEITPPAPAEPEVEVKQESPESPETQAEEPEAEPAPQEEPVAEQVPQSSSTPEEPATEEPEPTPAPEPMQAEVTEADMFKFLSEKLGKEITDISDLTPEPVDPLANDPELKAIAEWRERTGRPISDWAKFQRDYNAMSDEQVAREYLQHEYQDFTAEEIELEMQQYLVSEDDFDERSSARKRLELKKKAHEARKFFNGFKQEFNEPLPAKLTPEQDQAVKYYQEAQAREEQVKKIQGINNENLDRAIREVETIPLSLDKDLSIDFKPPQEARQSLREYMNRPEWYNQDGTLNAKEVVKDSFFLQNREAILREAYQQGVSAGLAQLEKKTNNTTLDRKTADSGAQPSQSDIVVEGLEDFGGGGFQIG